MDFRLFVIDSSPAIHRLVEEAASTEGFEVTAFSDGPSCLDEASRNAPQMIIADFHLEGLTFTTFCDRLGDLNLIPSTMVLALVNSSDRHDENSLRQRGVSAFVHKPVQVEQLRQTIKELSESRMTTKQDSPARARRSWPPESVTMGDDAPSVVEETAAEQPVAETREKIEIREPARRVMPLGPPGTEDLRPAAAAAAVAARNNRLKAGEAEAPAPPADLGPARGKDPSLPAAAPAASQPAAVKREPSKDQAPAFAYAKASEPPRSVAPPPPTAKAEAETRPPSKDYAPAFAAAKSPVPQPEAESRPPAVKPDPPKRAPSRDYAATVAAIRAAATPPEDMPAQGTPPAPAPPKAQPAQPEPAAQSGKGTGGNGGHGLSSPLEESMRGLLTNLLESLSQGSQAQISQLVSNLVAQHVNAELSRKIQSEVAAQVAAALPREEITRMAQEAAEQKLPALVAQQVESLERKIKQELSERTGDMVKDLTGKLLPEMMEPAVQKHLPDIMQQHMGSVDGLVKEAAQQAATGYTREVAERIIRQVADEQVGNLVTTAVADIAEAQVKQELARLTAPD